MQASLVTEFNEVCTQFELYTYLGSERRLVLPLSVAEFEEVCTQFKEKTAICTFGSSVWTLDPTQTSKKMLDTAFISYKG